MNTLNSAMMTAREYLDSLDDGRQVYIYGEKITRVTTSHSFRNSAYSISRLYSALHAPESAEVMTTADEDGHRVHRFFVPSRSPQDLLAARSAIAHWSRLSYGFMGRTPDYEAAFVATLGSDCDLYGPYKENAQRWHRAVSRKTLFLSHVLANPPVGRSKDLSDMKDIYLHVEKETDGGIIVRGTKMVATSAVVSNATIVAQNSASYQHARREEEFALCFIVPMNAPNLKILCRRSFEAAALSPFDNPLSSRFDENDSIMIFDGVFVPWENILIYRDVQKARSFYLTSGFLNRYPLQSGTRLAVKLDFLCGLLSMVLESNGTSNFRGVRSRLADVVALRNQMWALTENLCHVPEQRANGVVIPRLNAASTVRYFGTQVMSLLKPVFNTILGGAPILHLASWLDVKNPETSPLVDTYLQGTGQDATDRLKLVKLLWDALGSEFAGRHELYEHNYSGSNEQLRLDLLGHFETTGVMEECRGMVNQCMADYSLDGWSRPGWQFDQQCRDSLNTQ